ncbi:PE domain-containing protein [Actinophytocola sp.]|uniref:PE domain-containing protein n=1 Tax=Actinophytocola sp. TaxID=1872138 RepID=UPI002D709979|nr:PE domain-containing protein [Actinophytocola sp.]HYQ68462.1 PE domain-containing protein [Actinophytocola sp.]
MPFWKDGTDTGSSTSTLRVDPARVLQLKAELQPVHDEVEQFLLANELAWGVRPLGADPVSRETATAFNENASTAFDAAYGYLDELKAVLAALDQAAKTYNLVEDSNTQTFRQGVQ